MPSAKKKVSSLRDSRTPKGSWGGPKGAWLEWPIAVAVCRLDLRPPSVWQIFLAVLLTSLRYGGRDARLSVDDLSRLTGLSPRTVKGGVATLIDRGFLIRVGRYKCLRVNIGGMKSTEPGTKQLALHAGKSNAAGGADKLAPPKGKLVCPSPTTSIYVSSSKDKESGSDAFSPRQRELITELFTESTKLLGGDATAFPLPEEVAVAMGLVLPISYGEAFEAVARSGDRAKARDYTRAVLAFRRDERVQGQELM